MSTTDDRAPDADDGVDASSGSGHDGHDPAEPIDVEAVELPSADDGVAEITPEPAADPESGSDADTPSLFAADDLDRLRGRWRELQASFVDDPRAAVARADELVKDAVQELTRVLDHRTRDLAGRWNGHAAADTETLRQTLRDYRSVFDGLLGAPR
jgi:hypothetical protein